MKNSIKSQVFSDDGIRAASVMFPKTLNFEFTNPENRRLAIDSVNFDDIQANRVTSSGHRIRLTEDDRVTYLVPRRGSIQIGTLSGSFSGKPGNAFVFSPNTRTTRASPTNRRTYKASVVLVSVQELRRFLEQDDLLVGPDFVERQFDDRRALSEEAALRAYILFLEREIRTRSLQFEHPRIQKGVAALAKELFGQLFVRLQSTSIELPETGGLDAMYVARAAEYIRTHLEEPLTVEEVAAASSVSVRRLQQAFKKLRQATPRETLTRFRLDQVHELLASSENDSSVFQAALDCGFTHMGRFATAYKMRFGELPSATLRKARKLPPN